MEWASKERGIHMALVCGGGGIRTTFGENTFNLINHVLTNFSPRSKHRSKIPTMPQTAEIDILIAIDCISRRAEPPGLRFEYFINYDIHCNPVRIIQRFGRIDRVGSASHKEFGTQPVLRRATMIL